MVIGESCIITCVLLLSYFLARAPLLQYSSVLILVCSSNVPARYAKNRRLGIWVSAQRQQYKATIANQFLEDDDKRRGAVPLTQDRIDLLNDLGFTWTIRSRDSMGESWNQRFEELKQFKEEFGNCHVPTRYLPNPELGIWVGTQRYVIFIRSADSVCFHYLY